MASIGISQVMDRNGQSQAKLETVPIYVALHNINLGDPIDAEMVSLQEWPKDKVPRGAISKLEDLEGRRPRTAIIEGEPILEGKLLAPGQIADPIRSIPKGMRLKTIAVDAEKSAAGLLGPGDRVDVQLFVRKDERAGVETAKSKIILQNIRVFAVDQTVQRAADGGEERSDRQDRVADADARAGQQAYAGRADRRDQPDSAQPGRRGSGRDCRNTRSTTCSPAATRTAAQKSRATRKQAQTTTPNATVCSSAIRAAAAAEAAVPHGNCRSPGRPRSAVRCETGDRFAPAGDAAGPTRPPTPRRYRRSDATTARPRSDRDHAATTSPERLRPPTRCSKSSRSISTQPATSELVVAPREAEARDRRAELAITTRSHAKPAARLRPITKEVQGCTTTNSRTLVRSASCQFATCRSAPCHRWPVRLPPRYGAGSAIRSSVIRKISGVSDKLELTTNTSRILTLDKNIPRVQVNNPELVAVTPLSATQVQISAKKAGVTQVNLWDEDGKIHTVDVMIYGDARELASRAANAVPALLDQGLPLQRKPGADGLRRSARPRQPDHAAGRGLRPEGDQQHQRRRRAAGAAQGQSDGSLAHEAAPHGHRLRLCSAAAVASSPPA